MASSANVAKLENDAGESFTRLTHNQRALMRLRKDYLTLAALGVIALLVLLAIIAPLITGALGVDPISENLQKTFHAPDSVNLLGESRVIYEINFFLGM